MGDFLTSEQAASALGVTKATLYSYISRASFDLYRALMSIGVSVTR